MKEVTIMDIIITVIAFLGTIVSLGGVIFIFVSNWNTKKMQKINQGLKSYIKSKNFLLMKNAGENPCDTKKRFCMPNFSQECDYIIRRK